MGNLPRSGQILLSTIAKTSFSIAIVSSSSFFALERTPSKKALHQRNVKFQEMQHGVSLPIPHSPRINSWAMGGCVPIKWFQPFSFISWIFKKASYSSWNVFLA